MANPTPRSDLVKAVSDAAAILKEAIPDDGTVYVGPLRVAAMPVLLRELLDVEVADTEGT
jgi:hypothetical protein